MTVVPVYRYAATITKWVDGDTFDARVDLGFKTWVETRFRVYGIDTPERGEQGWAEATALAVKSAPSGTPVVLETYKAADKYGRWLADVYVAGLSVADILIGNGLAKPYFGGTKALGEEQT